MDIEIITTDDGSHSLFNKRLDEVYHSRKGALAEAEHVFIRAGLEEACRHFGRIELLEVGFGTGLNTLLTALRARAAGTPVRYTALETDPLPAPIVEGLNYPDLLGPGTEGLWTSLHRCAWERWQQVDGSFHVLKHKAAIEAHPLPVAAFNLVYFDAFAPMVQPRLWQADVFAKLFDALMPGGLLVTYSAKGKVRRDLQGVGFSVERLPGPAGKREMLRARRPVSG